MINYGVIATGNQVILIRCAELHPQAAEIYTAVCGGLKAARPTVSKQRGTYRRMGCPHAALGDAADCFVAKLELVDIYLTMLSTRYINQIISKTIAIILT